jgi:hypothetical protein
LSLLKQTANAQLGSSSNIISKSSLKIQKDIKKISDDKLAIENKKIEKKKKEKKENNSSKNDIKKTSGKIKSLFS